MEQRPWKNPQGENQWERDFYYLWASEKFSYSIFIFRNFTNLSVQSWRLLLDFWTRNPYHCTAVTTLIVVRTVLVLRAKFLLRLYENFQQNNALKNVPIPWKVHPEFMTVWPLEFYACPYGLYGFSFPRKSCPTPSSISVPINIVWQPWNACQYSQKTQLLSTSIFVHI